jgi:WD40 repeat protein
VRFSPTEELVCAGSAAGAVKVWDLEAARMVRTLTGHRAGIKALDFHPYGDFLATGSTDTNMKVNLHTFHLIIMFSSVIKFLLCPPSCGIFGAKAVFSRIKDIVRPSTV